MFVRVAAVAAALVVSFGLASAEERKPAEPPRADGAPLESIADEVAEAGEDERHEPEQSGMSRAVAETNETEFADQCNGISDMIGCGDMPD